MKDSNYHEDLDELWRLWTLDDPSEEDKVRLEELVWILDRYEKEVWDERGFPYKKT